MDRPASRQRVPRQEESRPTQPLVPSWRPLIRGIAILLASYVLFCHGCHGEEDNELLTGLPLSEAGNFHGQGTSE